MTLQYTAVGFPIEEVAPTADHLANHKTQRDQVQHRKDGDLLNKLTMDEYTDGSADDRAIDGDAALPDVEHRQGPVGVHLPLEDAVVGPGAGDGEGGHPQHTVQHVIFFDAELLAAAGGIDHCQNQAEGNDHAVKMDAQGAEGNAAGWIQRNAQRREGNFGIHIT